MKEYLPSKQFIARVIILVGFTVVFIGVYEITSYFKGRSGKNPTSLIIKPDTIQKDSNNNSIPDWQESLWGLDPTKNGPSNKEFILAKRAELAKENGTPATETPLSENDTISRELFSVVMSLQESGDLDAQALAAITNTVGDKITAKPIDDIYTKQMTTVRVESPIEIIKYYTEYLKLSNKYKDKNIGAEMPFIASALKNNDSGSLKIVGDIAVAYKSFGKELIKIPVPNNLLSLHIKIANDYEKVGQSMIGLTELLSNPINGMSALVNYKKYNDLLIEDMGKLADSFK